MSGMSAAQRIRRWMRSPWVTFSILIEAILIPAICVIWLIGKASDNERAALQQAYASVRQREGAIVRDQLLQKLDQLQRFLEQDKLPESESFDLGWWLADEKLETFATPLIQISDPEAEAFLEELRYLEQAFGSLAALEQIRFWLGEGTMEGLKLSGNRDLKGVMLLKAVQLSAGMASNDEYVSLLLAYLDEAPIRMVSGSAARLFLLKSLLPYVSDQSWIHSQIEGETLGLKLRLAPTSESILESGRFRMIGDCVLYRTHERVWFVGVGAFKQWLFAGITSSGDGFDDSLPYRLLEPGSFVTKTSPLEFIIDMGSPIDGWRLAAQIDEGSMLLPAKQKILVYVWVGVLATVASVLFAIIGIGMVKNEITLAKLKNDLAATVSHELKTPIASVRILVDTLLDGKTALEPKTQDYLELISAENQRLGVLVEKFLTFSRMERGSVAIDKRICRANDLIAEAESVFRSRFTKADYELKLELCEHSDVEVQVDSQILLTALGNLLENAYKYSATPREICIGCRLHSAQWVALEVQDHGEGISPVEQKRIFRKFYQPDRRLSNHRGGVGLGLSIVAYVAKLHGAKVELESELGKGSLFRILLPVYHAKDTDH